MNDDNSYILAIIAHNTLLGRLLYSLHSHYIGNVKPAL